MDQSEDYVGSFGCPMFSVIAFFVVVYHGFSWVDTLWYSIEYGVAEVDVHTSARPYDCDFLTAPLGSKDCWYKKQVQVFNADGVLVAGDNAPTYKWDYKTGEPIVSYDGGKTWESAPISDLKPKSVVVYWTKELD